MLAQFLVPMLAEKFGRAAFSTGENPLVIFPPAHPAVGELRVFEDGNEGRINIGQLTHGHFYTWEQHATREAAMQELAENLFEFICELFAGNYILWHAKNGGSGGWFCYDANEPIEFPIYKNVDKADWFFWSGPIKDIRSLENSF